MKDILETKYILNERGDPQLLVEGKKVTGNVIEFTNVHIAPVDDWVLVCNHCGSFEYKVLYSGDIKCADCGIKEDLFAIFDDGEENE